MSILDLGTGPSRPSVGKKSTRIFLGFGLLVAVIGIGSTFASTISINANQDIEFGQGVERTVFCGGAKSITVTPISSFANSSGDGTFGLTGITVSDIPEECSDRNFIIKVYDDISPTPLVLSREGNDGMDRANVWWAAGCPGDDNAPTCRLADYATEEGVALLSKNTEYFEPVGDLARVENATDKSFTVIFGRTVQNTEAVKKIVIETQNDSFGFGQYTSDENEEEA
jgi:hypothetical protein